MFSKYPTICVRNVNSGSEHARTPACLPGMQMGPCVYWQTGCIDNFPVTIHNRVSGMSGLIAGKDSALEL